ncbi:hypothetical protein BJV77DRAFT_660229 [Russula vinacea]|nr:hypothetical protein BJV77DRAFT_660229 [Russula vinacea]
MSTSVQNTAGALLAGAMFSAAFSGVLAVQIFFYLHRYPKDHKLYKLMVAWFWIIDTMQTTSIAAATWTYLILHYGDPDSVTGTKIYPSVTVAVSCTALTVACVNILQGVRIYELNHQSLVTLVPHVLLSVIRIALSTVIITKLFIAGSLAKFGEHFKPLVDVAFSLAAVADAYIACVLCYFLEDSRRNAPLGTKRMLNTLVFITINNGALTTIATVILWLTMQTNTIFLAVLFMTGKCYSNSQMATFNMRRWIHTRSIGHCWSCLSSWLARYERERDSQCRSRSSKRWV